MVRRRHSRKIRFVVFSLLLMAFGGGAAWLIFFSEYLRFYEIAVSGTESVNPEEIRAAVAEVLAVKQGVIFPRAHVLFYGPEELAGVLEQRFARVASVDFSPDIGRRLLNIEVKERAPEGFWCYGASPACFLLASDGVLLESIDRPAGIGALVIEDHSGAEPAPGTRPITPEWLAFIVGFSRAVTPDLLIRAYVLEPESATAGYIRGRTAAGWDILLNVEPGRESYWAEALQKLLEEEVGGQIGRLEYIDFRIPGRAYYKLR